MDLDVMNEPRLVVDDSDDAGRVLCGFCLAESIRTRTPLEEVSRFENENAMNDIPDGEYEVRHTASGYERRLWSPVRPGAWGPIPHQMLICVRCQETGDEVRLVPYDSVTGKLIESQGYLGREYHERHPV